MDSMWWRFRTDENALWCNIIRSIHGPSGGLDDASSLRSKRGPWYHIAKLKDDFLSIGINLTSLFKKKTAPTITTVPDVVTTTDGSSFSASTGNFLPANGLQGLYFNWAWSRPVRSGLEVSDLSEICELLAHLRLTDTPDAWEFTTDSSRFRWNKILPLKVNINTWRIIHKRVPTRSNLDYRGVDLDSVRCPICDDEIESEEHIFVMCNVAREAWKNIMLWWKIDNTSANNRCYQPSGSSLTSYQALK
ncbi:RNA-directed DNA polymerase, eukaryota, reverse transcriptase zinc-binding domain protein, partial [Tanacetum coccineum]